MEGPEAGKLVRKLVRGSGGKGDQMKQEWQQSLIYSFVSSFIHSFIPRIYGTTSLSRAPGWVLGLGGAQDRQLLAFSELKF